MTDGLLVAALHPVGHAEAVQRCRFAELVADLTGYIHGLSAKFSGLPVRALLPEDIAKIRQRAHLASAVTGLLEQDPGLLEAGRGLLIITLPDAHAAEVVQR